MCFGSDLLLSLPLFPSCLGGGLALLSDLSRYQTFSSPSSQMMLPKKRVAAGARYQDPRHGGEGNVPIEIPCCPCPRLDLNLNLRPYSPPRTTAPKICCLLLRYLYPGISPFFRKRFKKNCTAFGREKREDPLFRRSRNCIFSRFAPSFKDASAVCLKRATAPPMRVKKPKCNMGKILLGPCKHACATIQSYLPSGRAKSCKTAVA